LLYLIENPHEKREAVPSPVERVRERLKKRRD
jgi:hypothetical protein